MSPGVLLDTHIWLWLQVAPERITESVRRRLEDPDTPLAFSAVSAWEIAIKWALGRLPLPSHPASYVPERLRRQAVDIVPVRLDHALAVAELPPHHRDPFDRMLVAQSLLDGLPIVTADPVFAEYGVEVVRAD